MQSWPPAPGAVKSAKVATTGGTIIDAANIPGGIAALVDRRAQAPQVILATQASATTTTLPPPTET